MGKIDKKFYEGKPLLKPRSKKNPTGVKDGDIVTIEKVEMVKLPQTGDTYLVKFKEHEESLAMNKTNLKTLVELYGDDTDKLVGKKFKLIIVLANNPKTSGETPSIRVKHPGWQPGEDEEE